MPDAKDLDIVDESTRRVWDNSLGFTVAMTSLVLRRHGDKNVLPYVHIWLAFLLSLAKVCSADERVNNSYVTTAVRSAIPRRELCTFLNTLTKSDTSETRFESAEFIQAEKGDTIPLPEDYLIRGQVWSQEYFPDDLFRKDVSDDEEKNIEHASTVTMRAERVLNLGYRLCQVRSPICRVSSLTK
jgi:hypothetical protein